MRVLVAGAAGFIGYHLCERLLSEGHTVVGLDNFCTGQRRNIADLSRRRGFEFVEHDVVRPIELPGRLDAVYNLACPASPADFGPKALEIMDVCAHGVWRLLELARAAGATFVHTSTSEVYGNPDRQHHPQREEYFGNVNPIGPRACYDEGKRFAEALIVNYRRRYGIETRTVRIFNTYGPRMRRDDGRVLPNFISQALAGEPLTVHGDGSQTRSFCYVSDLVEGILRLAASDVSEPVNIGNPDEVSIADFARKIIALTGNRSRLAFVPRPADDPDLRRPDITRARTRLGWQPRVGLEEGLKRTIDAFGSDASGG
ncbi:MAG: SDR family oxidoreductase [Phycisphaerae bacterium]|jgi:dTDP-glucose 4,6-dehydratase